jgi:hypothetical protein
MAPGTERTEGEGMKTDERKVLAMAYLLSESLNRRELLMVILLLIGEYEREAKE